MEVPEQTWGLEDSPCTACNTAVAAGMLLSTSDFTKIMLFYKLPLSKKKNNALLLSIPIIITLRWSQRTLLQKKKKMEPKDFQKEVLRVFWFNQK